jgi:hypothetical protein
MSLECDRRLTDQEPAPPALQQTFVQSHEEPHHRLGGCGIGAVGSDEQAHIATTRPRPEPRGTCCGENAAGDQEGHQQRRRMHGPDSDRERRAGRSMPLSVLLARKGYDGDQQSAPEPRHVDLLTDRVRRPSHTRDAM